MKFMEWHKHSRLINKWILAAALAFAFGYATSVFSSEAVIRYFPSGAIYEYRWKLLALALAHTNDTKKPPQLAPFSEDVTQNRGISLLKAGTIDVIALGTNAEREAQLLPVKIDILRGIVGFRLLVIRAADQKRIRQMDDVSLRKQLMFGLNSQWADLPIMRANGFSVVTSSDYENLFAMLAANRFDAFPRGLNEAQRELDQRKQNYPQLAIEKSKALYFPYPVYFWVNKNNEALAKRIELGLSRSLADGSFRKLFESYHAAEITAIKRDKRKVILLDNTILPAGNAKPDTSWWWPKSKN